MLNLRSLCINGEWDGYQEHSIEKQFDDLYPNRACLINTNRRRLP